MAALYLVAAIAGQRVALPAGSVKSVVEIDAITPVPRVAPHVAGLAALRSRVLTLIDCVRSLELDAPDGPAARSAVIVAVESHQYGLLVDEVIDVVPIEGAPRAMPSAFGPGWARAVSGVIEHGDDLLLVLDPAALIDGPAARAA